jgi:dienelactone hydrolase
MLEFNEDPGNRFEGAIDAGRIGMTGHSLGGITTILTLYGPNRDERLRAAVPLSGTACLPGLREQSTRDVSVPVMFMAGSEDLLVPAAGNRYAYEIANAPRYWVELIGGNHVRFASVDIEDSVVAGALDNLVGRDPQDPGDEAEEEPADLCERRAPSTGVETISLDRQQELLRLFATPFFDAYLRDSGDAKRFLEEDLPGLTADAARYEFEAD